MSGTCTDHAGHVSAAKEVTVKLDRGAPVVTQAVAAAPTGANGWYTSDVAVDFTATDAVSGLATATQRRTSTGEGAAVEVESPAFTDNAGNTTAAGALSKTFKVDKTRPSAALSATFADSYVFGSVPAAPTCTAGDAGSGVATCEVSGYGTAVGTHTVTATAKDNAGLVTEVAQTYTVKPWTASGFFQPVDMGGVANTVKGGSTVPVKFELFADGVEQTALDAATFAANKVTCSSTTPVDDIELLSSGSTALRYDATSGQYVYNWKTPTGAGTCYALTMTAKDGVTKVTALFKLK